MKTLIIRGGDMTKAAEIIRSGGLAAVPTETVYGLSANGLDAAAVEKIYEVKGRPETKPINLLIGSMDDAERFCEEIPDGAYHLSESFWPGPLTMILKRRTNVPDIVTAGGGTVGVRCPAHEKTLELLRVCGVPLATPSANPSGLPSPKTFEAVLKYFDGKIECAIDGGACAVGRESTIVDMTVWPPRILRQGGLSRESIESCLGIGVV